MLRQVVIRSVRNTPKLAPAKWEQELDVRGSLAVEAELFRSVVTGAHLVFLHAQRLQPVDTELFPVGEPL